MSTNGDVERAELETLLESDPDVQMRYVVTCAYKTKRAVDQIPDQISVAIRKQRKADVRNVAVLCTVIATIISLATPILLHFV